MTTSLAHLSSMRRGRRVRAAMQIDYGLDIAIPEGTLGTIVNTRDLGARVAVRWDIDLIATDGATYRSLSQELWTSFDSLEVLT